MGDKITELKENNFCTFYPKSEDANKDLKVSCLTNGEDEKNLAKQTNDKNSDMVVVRLGNLIGHSSLHAATASHDPRQVELLLSQNGHNVNARDIDGNTALHFAAYYGYHDVTYTLLEGGADVNQINYQGKKPLLVLLEHRDIKMDQKIIDKVSARVSKLKFRMKDEDVKEELSEARACQKSLPHSRLTLRTLYKRTTLTDIDLEEINSLVKEVKLRILKLSREEKLIKISNALREMGDRELGKKLLALIERKALDYREIKLLLNEDAYTEIGNLEGKTPLHIAIEKKRNEVVTMLIESGADINSKDNNCWTPLHSAVNCENKEAVGMLLAAGVNKSMKNRRGLTPLALAKILKNRDIIELLYPKAEEKKQKIKKKIQRHKRLLKPDITKPKRNRKESKPTNKSWVNRTVLGEVVNMNHVMGIY